MHRSSYPFASVVILLALLCALAPGGVRPSAAQAEADSLTAPAASATGDAAHASPVTFIENTGQWDEGARFQVQGGSTGTVWLAEGAIWLTLLEPDTADRETGRVPAIDEHGPALESRKAVNIKFSFDGANTHPELVPFGRLESIVNYYLGNDPSRWREQTPVWGGVRYASLYPGVDLLLAGVDGHWNWQLDVTEDGVDLAAVRLLVEGADAIEVEDGHLRLTTAVGQATLPLPVAAGLQSRVTPEVEQLPQRPLCHSGPLRAGLAFTSGRSTRERSRRPAVRHLRRGTVGKAPTRSRWTGLARLWSPATPSPPTFRPRPVPTTQATMGTGTTRSLSSN